MKKIATLSITAAIIAGSGLLWPTTALAHDNNFNHRATHQQMKQTHRARHNAGISWKQDRAIHRQDRQAHRQQHQLSNGSLRGFANQNAYPNSYNSTYYSAGSDYVVPNSSGYYPAANNINGVTGYYPDNSYGYLPTNTVTQDGHYYTPDGHRFDHHGNHDDGPFDR